MSLTEKQKMLAGQLYNAADPELQTDQRKARRWLDELNLRIHTDVSQGMTALVRLLGYIGEEVVIRPPFYCDYGYNISIGSRTFINYDCTFLDCNRITIGEEVQIGPSVHIYTATHPLDPTVRRSGLESAHPVVIGNGVWLGGKTIVCPNVTIGENTVVGAGSVVTKDLPPNVLAMGSPARVIRSL